MPPTATVWRGERWGAVVDEVVLSGERGVHGNESRGAWHGGGMRSPSSTWSPASLTDRPARPCRVGHRLAAECCGTVRVVRPNGSTGPATVEISGSSRTGRRVRRRDRDSQSLGSGFESPGEYKYQAGRGPRRGVAPTQRRDAQRCEQSHVPRIGRCPRGAPFESPTATDRWSPGSMTLKRSLWHSSTHHTAKHGLAAGPRCHGDTRPRPSTAAHTPPSTNTSVPVMNEAASETKNSTTAASSSAVPSRPSGVCSRSTAMAGCALAS